MRSRVVSLLIGASVGTSLAVWLFGITVMWPFVLWQGGFVIGFTALVWLVGGFDYD